MRWDTPKASLTYASKPSTRRSTKAGSLAFSPGSKRSCPGEFHPRGQRATTGPVLEPCHREDPAVPGGPAQVGADHGDVGAPTGQPVQGGHGRPDAEVVGHLGRAGGPVGPPGQGDVEVGAHEDLAGAAHISGRSSSSGSPAKGSTGGRGHALAPGRLQGVTPGQEENRPPVRPGRPGGWRSPIRCRTNPWTPDQGRLVGSDGHDPVRLPGVERARARDCPRCQTRTRWGRWCSRAPGPGVPPWRRTRRNASLTSSTATGRGARRQ